MNTGILSAALAYACWGLIPIYFKMLAEVPALEILLHRMCWSLGFMLLLLLVRRQWQWLRQVKQQPKLLIWSLSSATVIAVNWLVYIWAVNSGHIVDASLGYFINPLVNVLIGSLFLQERLRRGQWAAVALAGLGVCWLTWQAEALPWIGLTLAVSFAAYALLRKFAALGAVEGFALETALLAPAAALGLFWLGWQGHSYTETATIAALPLLALSGPVTAIPLLLFAFGARRIPFSTLGLLQYIGPTGQLLLGVWVFHEPFPAAKLWGYIAIWLSLLLYTAEGFWQRRRVTATP